MTARRAELTITVTVEYDDEAAIIPIPSALPQRLAETIRKALTDLHHSGTVDLNFQLGDGRPN
jgi:hypothetical protein